MNNEQTVFSQLMELIPRHEFNRCVKRYAANLKPRTFSYWDHFLTMAFAQLTYRESLRDIEVCFAALGSKTYHMGIRGRVARSTLADANDQRDWRIWSDLACLLIKRARTLYAGEALAVEFANAMYALDSTTISLCLSLFPWARYQTGKGAVKVHTQLDLRGNVPSFILISQGKVNDVNFLDDLAIEPGALYVMDRGYFDFARLFRFAASDAFFVTRMKRKVSYRRVHIFSRDRHSQIRCDALIMPLSRKARRGYPQRLRLIEYFDSENNRTFVFITNNLSLPAQAIADIYRSRWQIELFFKWIKQHLRIKAFFGTSENALKTQIWIAVSVYLLVAIAKKQFRLDHSLHSILQVLSISSVEKTPILRAFQDLPVQFPADLNINQLDLFNIPTGQ
jgi:hypothetical protein